MRGSPALRGDRPIDCNTRNGDSLDEGSPARAGIDPKFSSLTLHPERTRFPRTRGDRPIIQARPGSTLSHKVPPHARG